jgi:hypothetical protein
MPNNNEKIVAAQAALLDKIAAAAEKTTNPSTLRTLAETYALTAGTLNGVQNVEVKSS